MVPITLLYGLVHHYFRYDAFTYRIGVPFTFIDYANR